MTLKQIARHLNWPRQSKGHLKTILSDLVNAGFVQFTDRRQYVAASEGKLIQGTLVVTRRGSAYLSTDAFDEDLYVPRSKLGPGMHRDRVVARVEVFRSKLEGRVLEVIERGTHSFVGIVHRVGKGFWLEPRDERLPERIRVNGGEAAHGELVAAEFTEWMRATGDTPTANIIKRIAKDGEAAKATETLIYDLGLPTVFPEGVIQEAEAAILDVDALLSDGHVDLREVSFFTIDPQSARDFDDAVSVEQLKNGSWLLRVAVADVSLLVTENSAMDREAFRRGTSVYLPDRVIPMLPDKLSGDLCSLRPKVDRSALVVQMEISADGLVLHVELCEAVIQSHYRLSYDLVSTLLEDRSDGGFPKVLKQQLLNLRTVTRLLRKKRRINGYLELEITEPKVALNHDGTVDSIQAYERFESHLMIEEAMLIANVSVANYCIDASEETLFRVHGEPDGEKLETFKETVGQLLNRDINIGELQALGESLKTVDDEKVRDLLSTLLLRAMMKAEYQTKLKPHFGLGFPAYLHFTSPIRRYPDLIVHRIVRGLLRGKKRSAVVPLGEVAAQSNRRERLALEAERDVVALYKCLWLESRIGEVFEGFVTHVSQKGAFVKLGETHCDGFVPFPRESQKNRGHRNRSDHQKSDEWASSELPLKLAQRVVVRLVNVSVLRRRVELTLVEEGSQVLSDEPI